MTVRLMNVLNAFTVDVEDYFQVSAFEGQIDHSAWDQFEYRVVENTQRMLRLLAAANVRGTFFVLGWIAERSPDLVREIADAGHEIGSHSYWHRLVYELSPEEFRDDLRRSKDVLEQITGRKVIAYRAPSFSITAASTWAFQVLAEEGFLVDSSVFPVYHDRYGIPDACQEIHSVQTTAGAVREFPAAVVPIGPLNLPVSGGGYFRMAPVAWTLRCLRRINDVQGQPFMFYIHPWELDPDQPRLRLGSYASRFRHYVNLASTERKLLRILRSFRFGRMCDVLGIDQFGEPQMPVHDRCN